MALLNMDSESHCANAKHLCKCDYISGQRENQLSRTRGNTHSSTKTLMEKKSVLLVDGA